MTDMTGKTALITGATNGIGLAAAAALAAMGARVLLHGRSAARGRGAVEAVKAKAKGPAPEYLEADLSSLAAVRALAAETRRLAPKLDVLINNAGLFSGSRRRVTADGFELTFAVNHLAPFLLTNLLLDTVTAAAPARIVTVASAAHRRAALDFDDLNGERRFSMNAYGQSKLANVLFTRALAKRLHGTGVTANCLHPGVVRTGIAGSGGFLATAVFGLLGPFFLSAEKGAETTVYLASAPEAQSVSGKYFDACKPVSPSAAAQDDAAAERLWQISAEMVGLGR